MVLMNIGKNNQKMINKLEKRCKKNLTIIRTLCILVLVTIKEYFAYRLNFLLWRLRTFLNLLIILFLWEAGLKSSPSLLEKQAFFSYLIYAVTISYLVLGTRTTDIAGEINSGAIVNTLLKPISFFRFYFYKDLADKMINLSFALFEAFLALKIFQIKLLLPQQIVLGVILLANGIMISFFINLLLSFIGFWSREVWGPRFIFFILVSFLSGAYFPLNLLPKIIYLILLLTPFPYLYYLPTKIFLGERFPLFVIFLSFFWFFLTYLITKKIWRLGNKNFSFWGR